MSHLLPQGKLPSALLARLLERLPVTRAIVGPRPGEDAAVLPAPDGLLVVTSDPITFTSADIGRHAVIVNANDIAAMGAEPRWMLATVLLPPGSDEQEVGELMASMAVACDAAGVSVVGGHTEVTDAVRRVVVAGTMLGTVAPDRLVTSAGARPGDQLILSKPIAIEGTAILADEARVILLARGLTELELDRARALSDGAGLSVLAESRILCQGALPHALHDVTEGGLATALRELAEASGVGLRLERGAVPILPDCVRVCAALGLDPLGLIGSGSLLVAVPPEQVGAACSALRASGIAGARIGAVTDGPMLELVEENGASVPLPSFARDEIARYIEARDR